MFALLACLDPAEAYVNAAEIGEVVGGDTADSTASGPAECGNARVDAYESCDDGERWGGDGCSADCEEEIGMFEQEPNDSFDVATPASVGLPLLGALPTGDTDCWATAVLACGAISVLEAGECSVPVVLALHSPTGEQVAGGSFDDRGCAVIDPIAEPGARFVTEGSWSVCANTVNNAELRGYALEFTTPDSATLGAPSTGDDTDGDAIPDSCDADLDGDGLENGPDNCPTIPNGPASGGTAIRSDGFVAQWLAAGAFTTGTTTGECRPSDEALVGESVPIFPTIGSTAGELVWTALLFDDWAYDLLGSYGSTPAPREAYLLVYVQSATARTLTLAIGADDGIFAWWNGTKVIDEAGCQGVTADQFQATVTIDTGWNTLLLKVRDWGGGWGFAARFLDDAGNAVTDLGASLRPSEAYSPDQSDQDLDGIGDICDPSPAGE